MNDTKPLGAGAWIAIGVGIGLVAVAAIVQFVILMAGVLWFGVLGIVLVSNYTEIPFEESPATGLAGEWVLDSAVADVSIHIAAGGFVALEDWPVNLLCAAAGQTFRDAKDLDWSRTTTVSGVAETDERVATIEVLLDPSRPGCSTSAGEFTGPNPQFEVSSMTQISDGSWLSPTGLVTKTPCE